MKRIKIVVLTSLLCGIAIIAKSQNQDASVEKSTYGLQVGLLGVWVHNESRLSDQIALRSEIGLDLDIRGGVARPKTEYFIRPSITIEPKWYYNLENRLTKSKTISHNSGNFLSLRTSYLSGVFINSSPGVFEGDIISIFPTWGIRRNSGDHFTFEAGFGLGYIYRFSKRAGALGIQSELEPYIHLRVGYRFN